MKKMMVGHDSDLDLDFYESRLGFVDCQVLLEKWINKKIQIMPVYINLKVCGLLVGTSNWIDNHTIGSDWKLFCLVNDCE